MKAPLIRAAWATALTLGALGRLCGQTPEAPSASPNPNPGSPAELGAQLPVQLDEFNVTAARLDLDTEQWFFARVEDIEVLSSASEEKTAWLVDELQRFSFALRQVAPRLRQAKDGPLALIICGRESEFAQLRPAVLTEGQKSLETVALRDAAKAIVLLNQKPDLTLLSDEDPASDDHFARIRFLESSQRVQRDYLYFLLALQRPTPAPWLREGLAQIYANIRITDDSISIGKTAGGSATTGSITGEGYFNAALAKAPLLPLEQLFRSRLETHDADDRELTIIPANTDAAGIWMKQCEAFVHWGLYGDLGRHEKEFQAFVTRLRREPLSEAMFKACFQLTYQDALSALRTHIENTRSKVVGVRAEQGQKIPFPPAPKVRDATPAEIARLKAGAHALSGRPEEARTILVRAYRKGERDPDLLAEIGLSDLARGETARARQFLEAAAARRTRVPRAYVELARLRLGALLEAKTSPAGKLLPQQVRSVIDPLGMALSIQPQAEAYALAAEAWCLSDAPPTAEQFEGLKVGVKLDPRNHDLVYRVALLATNGGYSADARALIALGEKTAQTNAQRARLAELAARLPKKTS